MLQILKKISKKTALVAVAAVIAGSGATAGVFAAIPHSTTGVISACRDNTSGALRVIDAENSESCTGSETAMSWSSSTIDVNSALLRLEPDPEDADNYVMNPARSRGVIEVKTIHNPESEGDRYICMNMTFMPEVRYTTVKPGVIGSVDGLDIKLGSQSEEMAVGIETYCGEGFDAVTFLSSSSGPATAQSILFGN